MWKTVALSAALFGSAALGLLAGARFVEPSVLPAACAIGLCLVGIVLIMLAPAREAEESAARETQVGSPAARSTRTITLEPAPVRSPPQIAMSTGPHPTLP